MLRYPFSAGFPELLSWDHCLALADHALYRAKKAGRNRWQCYRPNESALRNAIQARGIEEVRRLLRMQAEQAFEMGLIEVDRAGHLRRAGALVGDRRQPLREATRYSAFSAVAFSPRGICCPHSAT